MPWGHIVAGVMKHDTTTTNTASIIAKLRPDELEKVNELAGLTGHTPGMIALALSNLGETLTTDDAMAREIDPNLNAAKFLRKAMTRKLEECTAELPMQLDSSFADEQRKEAADFGREIGEWTGAMISLGLLAANNRQAILEALRGSFFDLFADATAYNFARSAPAVTEDNSELLPLYLPRKIVERLADAGRVADLEDAETALAEDILSHFLSDHDMLEENIANGYKLTDERKVLADLHVMFARWKAEDAEQEPALA